MTSIMCAHRAQVMTAEEALIVARNRFHNLCANGILGTKHVGPPVDPADVDVALAFLSRCGRTKVPACHSFDLRRAIGDVSLGAVIVAATALGFGVHSWFDITCYAPHALVAVNATDVRRVTNLSLYTIARNGLKPRSVTKLSRRLVRSIFLSPESRRG
jgi:hypothetical protein